MCVYIVLIQIEYKDYTRRVPCFYLFATYLDPYILLYQTEKRTVLYNLHNPIECIGYDIELKLKLEKEIGKIQFVRL